MQKNSYLKLYKGEFPNLVSYERFVVLQPRILMYLQMLLNWLMSLSKKTGISFIDATSINRPLRKPDKIAIEELDSLYEGVGSMKARRKNCYRAMV